MRKNPAVRINSFYRVYDCALFALDIFFFLFFFVCYVFFSINIMHVRREVTFMPEMQTECYYSPMYIAFTDYPIYFRIYARTSRRINFSIYIRITKILIQPWFAPHLHASRVLFPGRAIHSDSGDSSLLQPLDAREYVVRRRKNRWWCVRAD